ncbi:MAG: aldo/keto reductase [Planctomycetota bacterium]|nr:aldo/keto reductase [Planctomycetota bacterium]
MTELNTSGTIQIGTYTVHRLGFGAMRLTGEGVWGEHPDPARPGQVLRRAIELGVDFIDTADSYGPEVNERQIGETLGDAYPDDLVIATKAGFIRTGPGEWKIHGDPKHIRAACEGSLKRLRLERIPLYQLHRIDPRVPVADTIGAMLELRQEGKIEHIGLSEVSVEQLREVQQMTPVVSVQNRYNVGDREWDDLVDVCAAEGIAFIPWYPVGAGDLGAVGEVLDEVAAAHDTTRYVVALAWLLHRSPAMAPIPGTSSITHLEENMSAATLVDQITDEEWARLDAAET